MNKQRNWPGPLLLILLLMSFTNVVRADHPGWVGSGGEVFRFAKNPWFVKNTKTVSYCIQVDTASVSASEQTVRDVFKEAIAYWKKELAFQGAAIGPGFASLGTQDFVEQSACDKETPLRILVGHGALSKDEADWLQEPRRYIGISVRTEYDTVKMAGQGFLFISSDLGPMAYNTLPNTDHLVDKAWQQKRLLLYAFMHELGHIFGIPHTGSGLMSEVFLDQVLHKRFSKFYLENPVQSFLNPPMLFDICTLTGTFNATFFQVPTDTACMHFEGKNQSTGQDWDVYSKKTPTSDPVLAGSIHATRLVQLDVGAKPSTVIHLPAEQTVFSLAERTINTFMLGPIFNEGGAKGTFTTTTSHRPFDLQIDFRPDAVTMTGLVGGRMMPVMVYSPPSLLNQIFPIGM
jgi:hypothetical protein